MSVLVIEEGAFRQVATQWVSDILDHARVAKRLDAIRMGGVFRLTHDHLYLQGRVACCDQAALIFGYQAAPKTQARFHFLCTEFAENNCLTLTVQERITAYKNGPTSRAITGSNPKALAFLAQMKNALDRKGQARLAVTSFPTGTACTI